MSNDNELPDPVEYTGSARALRNSRFLTATDLVAAGIPYGGSITVTIDKVMRRDNVVSKFSGKAETMTTIMLVGKEKELRCGAIMQDKLIELFGDDTTDWKGKKVQLVVTQKDVRGELVDSLVIRAVPVKAAAKPAPKAAPAPAAAPAVEGEGAEDDIPF